MHDLILKPFIWIKGIQLNVLLSQSASVCRSWANKYRIGIDGKHAPSGWCWRIPCVADTFRALVPRATEARSIQKVGGGRNGFSGMQPLDLGKDPYKWRFKGQYTRA